MRSGQIQYASKDISREFISLLAYIVTGQKYWYNRVLAPKIAIVLFFLIIVKYNLAISIY